MQLHWTVRLGIVLGVLAAPVAAQDVVARVNFQPEETATPAGWSADSGDVFDDGRGYGWDDDVATREYDTDADDLHDTYAQVSNSSTVTWEYELPDGTYLVTLVAGSPRWSGTHTVAIEGDLVLDGVETRRDFVEVTDHEATVTDGRLSVTLGGGPGRKTKICYLEIRTNDDGSEAPPEPAPDEPPQVMATADVASGAAPLTVRFSGAVENGAAVASAVWAFGDGATGTGLEATHTYDTPGTYEARLTVTGEGGLTGEAAVSINVAEPSAPPPAEPEGETRINFQPEGAAVPSGHVADVGSPFDAERGYGWNKIVSTKERDSLEDQRLDTYAYVSNSSAATWEYVLPDGDYAVTVVAGTPRYLGQHTVALEGTIVIDNETTGRGEFVEVVRHPVTVADGRLTVRIGGSDTSRKTKLCYLVIHGGGDGGGAVGLPPTVTVAATPTSGVAPLDVTFTGGGADPDGSGVSFAWDLGDGASSTEQSPRHTYAGPGTYTARLTVTDGDGRSATASVVISVANAAEAPMGLVTASVETDPVPKSGDAADDPAIWVHPTDRSLSVIIGTDKASRYLIGYDLSGAELWRVHAPGGCNNVDVRGDVVACSLRYDDAIGVYRMNPGSRTLTELGTIEVEVDPYGFALYESPTSGGLYAFVSDKGDDVEQWKIELDPLRGTLVRELETAKVEGMAADDESGLLFLAEENVGLYVYDAEPTGGSARTRIGSVQDSHLEADLEGVCLYRAADGKGYVIVSVQDLDEFAVYDRQSPHAYLGSFRIAEHPDAPGPGRHDGVSNTDGIDVINLDLGPAFPFGVFVAQDGKNTDPSEAQNFKLVPWERIADLLGLLTDATYEPE